MVAMLALLSTGLSLSLSRADLAAVVVAEPRLLCAKADTIAASARLGHPVPDQTKLIDAIKEAGGDHVRR
uniref:Uncharacterized protein n=1 Tax=Oryza nivara TaxID=4536 RepID=A0A0E0GQF3_ORYNI